MACPSIVGIVEDRSNLGRDGTTRNGWVEIYHFKDRLPVPIDCSPNYFSHFAPAWPGPPPTVRTAPTMLYEAVRLEQVILDRCCIAGADDDLARLQF
jgi:hypothetical protein